MRLQRWLVLRVLFCRVLLLPLKLYLKLLMMQHLLACQGLLRPVKLQLGLLKVLRLLSRLVLLPVKL